MKILHVMTCVRKNMGGVAEVVPRICEEQVKAGNEVAIAVLEDKELTESAERAMSAGVRIVQFKRLFRRPLWWNLIAYSDDLRVRMPSLVAQYDIVHIHGLWQYPAWFAGMCARRLKKPYVVMPHGSLEPERLRISRFRKYLSGIFFDRRLLNKSSSIWATAESEQSGIEQYGVSSHVDIMPLGLDSDLFGRGGRDVELLKKLGVEIGRKVLLYFSRITPVKGLDILAEAWKAISNEHPDWQLLIVGPDDRGYTYEAKRFFAEKCRLGSYVFHDPVFKAEKFKLLNSVDALVLPTRSENWSIAVAEAMASGKPVVCTKGAPWRCINEIDAGRWVGISVSDVENGLRDVLGASDLVRGKMGENGKKWVRENLDWRSISMRMTSNYDRVLKETIG